MNTGNMNQAIATCYIRLAVTKILESNQVGITHACIRVTRTHIGLVSSTFKDLQKPIEKINTFFLVSEKINTP